MNPWGQVHLALIGNKNSEVFETSEFLFIIFLNHGERHT
jgi:hypothetical protein